MAFYCACANTCKHMGSHIVRTFRNMLCFKAGLMMASWAAETCSHTWFKTLYLLTIEIVVSGRKYTYVCKKIRFGKLCNMWLCSKLVCATEYLVILLAHSSKLADHAPTWRMIASIPYLLQFIIYSHLIFWHYIPSTNTNIVKWTTNAWKDNTVLLLIPVTAMSKKCSVLYLSHKIMFLCL